MSAEEFVAATAAELAVAGDGAGGGYNIGAPLEQSYAGLERYWSKRAAVR
jgi:hypothetical protein